MGYGKFAASAGWFAMAAAAFAVLPAGAQETTTTRRPMLADISADGKQIVYADNVYAGAKQVSTELRAVGADGANDRLLASGTWIGGLSVSPDGRSVVFHRQEGTSSDLWMVSLDGSGLRQVTRTPGSELRPRFTLDGKGVLFVRTGQELFAKPTGWLVDVATGAERKVLDGAYEPSELGPLPEMERGWYAIGRPLLDDGKPDQGFQYRSWVLKVPMDGSAPRPYFVAPGKASVTAFQAGRHDDWDWKLIHFPTGNLPVPHLLTHGEMKPLAEPNVLRVSADRKLGVGIALDRDIQAYVAFYDLEKQTRRPLTGKPAADLLPRAAVDEAEFGKALNALINAAADEFKTVRVGEGKPSLSYLEYGSSVQFPGLPQVQITVPEKGNGIRGARAEALAYRGEDAEVSKSIYREWVERVQRALPEWKGVEGTKTVLDNPYVFTRFRPTAGGVEVEVEQSTDRVLGAQTRLRVTRDVVKRVADPPANPAPAPPAGEFARVLNDIILGSLRQFEKERGDVVGEPGADDTTYRAKVILPGAESAVIAVFKKFGPFSEDFYTARFSTPDGKPAARGALDALLTQVKPALSGWKHEERASEKDGRTEIIHTFRNPTDIFRVRVNFNYFATSDLGSLTLTVIRTHPENKVR